MKTDFFPWDDIFRDSAEILSGSIAVDKKPISKVSELYKALEKLYRKRDMSDMLPKPSTFNKRMHAKLGLDNSQRILKNSLYKLIGQYYNMSIEALSQHLTIKEEGSGEQVCYLFMRLKRGERSITENRRLLFSTSKHLKQKFSNEILFLSYDDDTIVLMLPDDSARQRVKAFAQSCMADSEEARKYA
ncbi:MAG: hypothetical protein IJX24_07005 [Oscillospiraceae bacterium]|nr:hypothetical protein [Oscillospiraceae bacterium]